MGIVPLDPLKAPKSPEDVQAVRSKHQLKVEGRWDRHQEVMDEIVVDDLEYVVGSDFLIVLLDTRIPAFGTFTEMWEAYKRGIPIYVVAPNNLESELHSMPLVLVDRVFRSFDELMVFIEEDKRDFKRYRTQDQIFTEPDIEKQLWGQTNRRVSPSQDPRGVEDRKFYIMVIFLLNRCQRFL